MQMEVGVEVRGVFVGRHVLANRAADGKKAIEAAELFFC
jgi:hypothetical protein